VKLQGLLQFNVGDMLYMVEYVCRQVCMYIVCTGGLPYKFANVLTQGKRVCDHFGSHDVLRDRNDWVSTYRRPGRTLATVPVGGRESVERSLERVNDTSVTPQSIL